MLKKIMLLGAAIAAFVAIAAPAAQAGEVTNFLGEEAEAIEASSENLLSTATGGGVLECETVVLKLNRVGTGHYTTPDTKDFIAQGHNNNHSDPECVTNTGITILITSVHATVKFLESGNATAIFNYAYQITHPVIGPIPCEFETKEGTESEASSYTPTTDEARIEGEMQGGGAGGAACASGGEIHGDFTITDEFGEPTSIH